GDSYMNSATTCGATGYASFGCGGGADGPSQVSAASYAGATLYRTSVFRGIFAGRLQNNIGYVEAVDGGPTVPLQTIALVTDGTAKTILFGHTTSNDKTINNFGWYSPFNIAGTSVFPNLAHACPDSNIGHYTWLLSAQSPNQLCSHSTAHRYGFSSHHGNAWPVAMVDGSVRWLKRSIDQKVYNALGSKNGERTYNFENTTSFSPEALPNDVD
ncbi:MAG: DUF1559 domain-containing protein, partial [Planctomycetia bacterium]